VFDYIKDFTVKNLKAVRFGLFLVIIIFSSYFINIPYITRYDFIFMAALLFQIVSLMLKIETKKEFFVIILFHILATIIELFKTNPEIAS
jgi:uncharacterized membrane protein YoaT (DUF817 family)